MENYFDLDVQFNDSDEVETIIGLNGGHCTLTGSCGPTGASDVLVCIVP